MWHTYVARMAKHVSMVGGPLWRGAAGPLDAPKSGTAWTVKGT